MLSELTNNIESLNNEMFFLKEIKLYSCNINFVYKYIIFEKNKNAFPLYPIVIDALVNFQYRGQLSFE